MKPVVFDIETSGFSIDEDYVCGVFYDGKDYYVSTTIEQMNRDLERLKDKYRDMFIVTYNGENYRGGFDFAFLRTLFAKKYREQVNFPFKGVKHLDIYPLFDKRFNTTHDVVKPPSSSISASDVKNIAQANEIEYTTKPKTLDILEKLRGTNWLGHQRETTESRADAQSVYQMIFDPEGAEEYIDGGEVPELYKKGNVDKIIRHCKNDVKRTLDLYHIVDKYAPRWEVERNINEL